MTDLTSSSETQPIATKKSTIDKDLKRIVQLEKASVRIGLRYLDMSFGLLFVIGVWIFTYFKSGSSDSFAIIAIASVVGAYMAMNIGANDVANNVGPAVGSKALTMLGALVIAAVFEAAGALIAGGEVVTTISKGIVPPESFGDSSDFIAAMLSALMAAALWINLATLLGAPVSTTHSIVGAVMGAGIAAAGMGAVNWPAMGAIAASWVISPVMGGVIAALFLGLIKYAILFQEDKVTAARRWIPIVIGIMSAAFAVYLTTKGLNKLWAPDPIDQTVLGLCAFVLTYLGIKRRMTVSVGTIENTRKGVGKLFRTPLIFAAALLSFAHGSNDVANAVGPLAAIVSAVSFGTISAKVTLPFWVLAIGGIGIAIGLLLFGPKIIKIVGEKITKLNPIRAFCVALSAALTVIVASGLGLPVSSTHIAVGAVFGVGFLREFITNRTAGPNGRKIKALPADPALAANVAMVRVAKARKRKLVRRRYLMSIAAAWIITVPASAALAAVLFLVVEQFM